MARILADSSGAIGSIWTTAAEIAGILPGAQPPANSLDFDPDTNAALVADLKANVTAYRLQAGALTKDGQPVAIAADGLDEVDRKALAQLRQQMADYLALPVTPDTDFDAFLNIASPNTAQTAAALKAFIRATPSRQTEVLVSRRLVRVLDYLIRRLIAAGLIG